MSLNLWQKSAIDSSPLISSLLCPSSIPLLMIWICGENHLRLVWRLSYGLGLVPAIGILLWRLVILQEPSTYKHNAIKRNVPYLLVFKRYWRSIIGVSLAWWSVSIPLNVFLDIPLTSYSLPQDL